MLLGIFPFEWYSNSIFVLGEREIWSNLVPISNVVSFFLHFVFYHWTLCNCLVSPKSSPTLLGLLVSFPKNKKKEEIEKKNNECFLIGSKLKENAIFFVQFEKTFKQYVWCFLYTRVVVQSLPPLSPSPLCLIWTFSWCIFERTTSSQRFFGFLGRRRCTANNFTQI